MLATHLIEVEIPFAQSEIVAININKEDASNSLSLNSNWISQVIKLKRRYFVIDQSLNNFIDKT